MLLLSSSLLQYCAASEGGAIPHHRAGGRQLLTDVRTISDMCLMLFRSLPQWSAGPEGGALPDQPAGGAGGLRGLAPVALAGARPPAAQGPGQHARRPAALLDLRDHRSSRVQR